MMNQLVRILQVEDSESDAGLVLRVLRKAGMEIDSRRVDDAPSLREALRAHTWDVIICDYQLPQFGAPAAFTILQETGLDIPFIVVSGTIGEERAVAMMKSGVNDYLMKSHLERLAPAVQREISEARNRFEHRRANRALAESEARFNLLFQSDVAGMYVGDAQRITETNQYFLQMLGYTPADVRSGAIHFRRLAPSGEEKQWAARLRSAMEDGVCPAFQGNWLRKDGSPVPVLAGAVRIRSGADSQLLGFALDLTEQNHLREQLLQSQKIEGLGRLAGGIAHDFNNLLTVISGYSAMVLEDTELSETHREWIEGVAEAAVRAARLTRQLLAFSRKQIAELKVVNLNQVIQDFEKLLVRVIGEDVTLELSLAPDAGLIRADPSQLEQMIMNLAVNARDAMPGNGTIYISTSNRRVERSFSQGLLDIAPGEYIQMTVRDTGPGIPADIVPHIFEPFFTTKEVGRGTGLGLATVYGIVKQAGGWIWLSSEPGQGATFVILLPATSATEVDVAPLAPLVARASPGGETVLLVEDDETIRAFLGKALTQHGYAVLEAPNGRVALELARDQPVIHIALTDAVMPVMGGADFADRMKIEFPHVPVVCISGYAGRDWRRQDWAAFYLPKPFTAAEMLSLIRDVLDRS
jgi:two-component system, cell cycle sensor histidine kinase and response regulator CckA